MQQFLTLQDITGLQVDAFVEPELFQKRKTSGVLDSVPALDTRLRMAGLYVFSRLVLSITLTKYWAELIARRLSAAVEILAARIIAIELAEFFVR